MNTTVQTTLETMRQLQKQEVVTMGFGNSASFELMQRAAKMLSQSTLVPIAYRARKENKEYDKVTTYEENPNAISNCIVALNMSQRIGADPLMVMQNLYIVEGRPSWSSQFIIAAINSCGRYSPLRFEMTAASEPRDVEYMETKWTKLAGQKDRKEEVKKTVKIIPRTCIAWATELATSDRLESPPVTMDMAVAEGWLQKNGSKWKTMPEVMLRYRAAAFFGKLYAPELLMGLQTAEEAQDIIDVNPDGTVASVTTESLRRRKARPADTAEDTEQKNQPDFSGVETIDRNTGEITPPPQPMQSEPVKPHNSWTPSPEEQAEIRARDIRESRL